MIRARAPVALALVALVSGGCGGDDDREPAGDLRWDKEPVLVRPSTQPNDRIVAGKLRNDGRARLNLKAADLRLRTADGRTLPTNAAFVESFLHGLYPPTRLPGGREPPSEERRLGRVARVEPGQAVPLTISWRQPPGTDPPVRIEWPRGSIPIPAKQPVGTGSAH